MPASILDLDSKSQFSYYFPEYLLEMMCDHSFDFPEQNSNKRPIFLHFTCPVSLDSKVLLPIYAGSILD